MARPIFGRNGESPYPPALLEVGSPMKGADRERGRLERRWRIGRGALAQAELRASLTSPKQCFSPLQVPDSRERGRKVHQEIQSLAP